MNYADIKLGTWYPSGGIRSVATAVHSVAVEQGVEFVYDEPIKKIHKKEEKYNFCRYTIVVRKQIREEF